MAKCESYVPFLLRYEAATIQKDGETLEALFERAKKKGFSNDLDDSGGATMCGITLAKYVEYCAKKGLDKPNTAKLKAITYAIWFDIVYTMFWAKCKADDIASQSVAEIIVDWCFNSGLSRIKNVQSLVEVTADGAIGPVTLAAINARDGLALFNLIKMSRFDFYDAIIRANSKKAKFKNGWYNRLNGLNFKS